MDDPRKLSVLGNAGKLRDGAAVRVVVLNFNRPQLTIRCSKSLLLQQGVNIDLVVVDNWSNEQQLRELRDGLPAGVTLLENGANLGYAAGNNVGLRAKPGVFEFALVVNNDVITNNAFTVRRLVDALRSSGSLAACSPLVCDVGRATSPDRSIQVRRIPNFWELLIVSSSILRRLPLLREVYERQIYADKWPFEANSVIACDTINGCCFLIRASALERIGYLDQGTFLYCEELILGFQLREAGLGCALVTQTSVVHEQGASAGRNAAGSTIPGMLRRIRSERYFAGKYLRAGMLARLMLEIVGALDILAKVTYGALRRFAK